MNHDEIQWEYCPVTATNLHGRYRRFDLHRWIGFICFYSSEGEATKQELQELLNRISPNKGVAFKVKRHPYMIEGETCLLKERLGKQKYNYCLTVHASTLEQQLAKLDTIIDALWQDSGLRPSPEPMPVGRWR